MVATPTNPAVQRKLATGNRAAVDAAIRVALPLLLLTVVLLPLATAAHAQADDKAYCAQLVDLYRRYVQNSPGRGFDVEASRALDDCRKGNPEGIPVLEKKLRENKITPPGGGEFKP
jgi:hypothetical protein